MFCFQWLKVPINHIGTTRSFLLHELAIINQDPYEMTTSQRQKFSNCENFVQTVDWELEFGDLCHIPLKDSVSLTSTCLLN